MTAKRQLAAIMYCDIAGFSNLKYSDSLLAEQIRTRHLTVFTEAHEKYHGKITQHLGDTTLSIFQNAAEAVECAYYIQLELRRNPEIPLRVGIHSGEIVHDDQGVYGDGLKVASRVERMSEPGSILITAKVHDDVKSHPWITSQNLGTYKLDDVDGEKELYVVTNRGLVVPSYRSPSEHRDQSTLVQSDVPVENSGYTEGKSKLVAALLALLLGPTGAHRFYLGQRFRAFLYIAATTILTIISFEEHAPYLLIMFIVSLLDAVLLAVMPSIEFDIKFNEKWRKRVGTQKKGESKKENIVTFRLLKEAVKKFESKQFDQAVVLFDRILVKDKRNAVAHFYLACCFSMLRDSDDAFYHLEAAIGSGFEDFDRIEEDKALKYIRTQSRFQAFRHTYLKVPLASLPSPSSNLLDKRPPLSSI
ncbi:MAG: NINE protein [Saprospiraceae bacterium]|nr:NINE protein [Saprospiraceae bacterium]